MSKEELMQVRYKLIALFPGCDEKEGHIFYQQNVPQGEDGWGVSRFYTHSPDKKDLNRIVFPVIENYPHLFRKLEWWEDRKTEDLPEYVKSLQGNSVRSVQKYELNWDKIILTGDKTRPIKYWLPATKEEYEAFITPPHPSID